MNCGRAFRIRIDAYYAKDWTTPAATVLPIGFFSQHVFAQNRVKGMMESQIALDDLIRPTSVSEFRSQYFEKKPLVVHRRSPTFYRHLFSLSDIDKILTNSSLRVDKIRLAKKGEMIPNERYVKEPVGTQCLSSLDIEAVFSEYRDGATLIAESLQNSSSALHAFCAGLEAEFGQPFQINSYLTPGHSWGFPPHSDSHDVFILQIHGSKEWRIYGNPVRLPRKGKVYDDPKAPVESTDAFTLEPGDLAYLPRGYVHSAEAGQSPSLHLTVGITGYSWSDLIVEAVREVFDGDERFRETLPPEVVYGNCTEQSVLSRFQELLAVLAERATPKTAAERVSQRFFARQFPLTEGRLTELTNIQLLGLHDVVSHRGKMPIKTTKEGEKVCLWFGGKKIKLPDYTEPDLRFMLRSPHFRPADLPGELDDESRLVLIRRLIREGLLIANRFGS